MSRISVESEIIPFYESLKKDLEDMFDLYLELHNGSENSKMIALTNILIQTFECLVKANNMGYHEICESISAMIFNMMTFIGKPMQKEYPKNYKHNMKKIKEYLIANINTTFDDYILKRL